jgi:SAM-dependent methyltransferase
MHTDVTDLRDFYATPLGLVVRRLMAQKIRSKWPRPASGTSPTLRGSAFARGTVLMGFGFASPFLGSFRGEASHICALMPEGQGALVWPTAHRNMSVLVEEEHLPLPDNSVDRMLIIHGLEVAERPTALLREMWRVITPSGRLLIVVPNRSGVWARMDTTPFGQGRPYSRGQLDTLLREAMFTPLSWDSALYIPPIDRGVIVRSAATIERIGTRVSGRFAGVLMVEATKELIAPIGTGLASRVQRNLIPVHTGALVPSRREGEGGGCGRSAF